MSRTDGPVPPASAPRGPATPSPASTWPVVNLTLTRDGRAIVNGRTLSLAPGDDARRQLMGEAAKIAAALGRDVGVTATDPSGTRYFIARREGGFELVSSSDAPWAAPPPAPQTPAPPPAPSSAPPPAPSSAPPPATVAPPPATVAPPPAPAAPPPPPAPAAAAFERAVAMPAPVPRNLPADGRAPTSVSRGWYRTPAELDAPLPPTPSPDRERPDRQGPGLTDARPLNAGSIPPGRGGALPDRVTSRVTGSVRGPATALPERVARRGTPPAVTPHHVRRPVAVGVGLGLSFLVMVAAVLMAQPTGHSTGSALAPPVATDSGAAPRNADKPQQPPPSGPVSSLPGGLPGYSTRPAWAVTIAGWTKVVTTRAVVAARDDDGRLVQLDPATGAVRHRSTSRWGAEWDGPWFTRIGDRDVLALASRTALVYWPLGGRAVTDTPVRIDLPTGAQVGWNGSSPLVTAGASVWVLDGTTLQRVPLPTGARPLAADGDDVLAQLGSTWLRASAIGYQTHTVPVPAGASGPPARMVDVAGRYLLVVWPRQGRDSQKITLVDTTRAAVLLDNAMPDGVDVTRAAVRRQVSGPMTAVGQVVVDPANQRISGLLPRYVPVSLGEGHVYAVNGSAGAGRKIVDIMLKKPTGFTVLPVGDKAVVPFAIVPAGSGRLALMIVTEGSRSQLMAAPSTG